MPANKSTKVAKKAVAQRAPAKKREVRKNLRCWNDWSDSYQSEHGCGLTRQPRAWGVWRTPEAELRVLGEVRGKDVLEFGCGAAQWSIALAEDGARPVALDLSDRQLAYARTLMRRAGVSLPLLQANGEDVPLASSSFDIVFCDHGAMTFGRPERTLAEAARLLRLTTAMADETPPAALGYWLGGPEAMDALALRAALSSREIEPDKAVQARFGAGQTFPVRAADLPGLQGAPLGRRLSRLKAAWVASDFSLTKSALLADDD